VANADVANPVPRCRAFAPSRAEICAAVLGAIPPIWVTIAAARRMSGTYRRRGGCEEDLAIAELVELGDGI